MLGTSSENSEILSKRIVQDRTAMSDTELAADLLEDVIAYRGVREPIKNMLERAYKDLVKVNKKWTRRRVRSIFNKEASRIDNREIAEMRVVIEEKERHAAYKAETARIAQMAIAPKTNASRRFAQR